MPEKQIVTPLDSEEIKDAIATKIVESILIALNHNCDFYQIAYPKFKAKWQIEGELDNFGTTIKFSANGELPFTPPNVLRKECGMPIPVIVESDGKSEQQAIFYKKERESRRYIDD